MDRIERLLSGHPPRSKLTPGSGAGARQKKTLPADVRAPCLALIPERLYDAGCRGARRIRGGREIKIGILAVSRAESIDVFLDTLEALGWIGGKTLAVVFPDPSSEDATLARNLRHILAAGVDLVIAQTRSAVLIATNAASAVPVVMGAFNGDPVKEGIVRSLERPGGNVTGTYYRGQAGGAQRLALLKELIPDSRRIGVLMNPQNRASMELAENLAATAHAMDFSATLFGTRACAEIDRAFEDAADAGVQAVVTVTGADMYSFRKDIVAAQAKHRLPAIMGSIGFPELGGLAKLGPDIPVLWRKMAAVHVDPILKGAKLILASQAHLTIHPALYQLPYDLENDFAPIALVARVRYLLLINPAVPANTLGELLSLLRSRPGQFNFASVGAGTSSHVVGELFKKTAKVDIVHVPYKGAPPAYMDLVGGQVHLMFASPLAMSSYIKNRQVKAIAIAAPHRSALLPEFPTFAESGMPDFEGSAWWAVITRAGVPPKIVARLNQEINGILLLPQIRERLATLDVEPAGGSIAELGVYLRAERAKWAAVIKDAGITVQ